MDKLTVSFCLHEIARNHKERGCFAMRIGCSVITEYGDTWLVIDWHNNKVYFPNRNLQSAIEHFIKCNDF